MKISVIICTYNRAASLQRALMSLSAMCVPKEMPWEILVVDNNSDDGTRDLTARFAQHAEVAVRYLFERRQGLNYARNTGVEAAMGELLFFIDDDVEVTPNWLVEMAQAFESHAVGGVGGRVLLKSDLERPAWWHGDYDDALGKFDPGDKSILSDDAYTSIIGIGANLGFKRSVFAKHGGFRPDLDRRKNKLLMGGDVEFALRIKKAGELTMYYPAALVHHCPDPSRLTKSYLRRWYFRFGEWEAQKASPGIIAARTLATTPRWRYWQAAEQMAKTVLLAFAGRCRERLDLEIQFLAELGYLYGAAKNSINRVLPRPS